VTIDIRVGEPTGVDIAPDLWGIFLEDLNDALDGGLNAETSSIRAPTVRAGAR
jgi:hypothetical protein